MVREKRMKMDLNEIYRFGFPSLFRIRSRMSSSAADDQRTRRRRKHRSIADER